MLGIGLGWQRSKFMNLMFNSCLYLACIKYSIPLCKAKIVLNTQAGTKKYYRHGNARRFFPCASPFVSRDRNDRKLAGTTGKAGIRTESWNDQ
jgi:hypothetical protein